MIQGRDDMAWVLVVVMNIVSVVKFGIYLKVCLKGFVDGLDLKCERVRSDSITMAISFCPLKPCVLIFSFQLQENHKGGRRLE